MSDTRSRARLSPRFPALDSARAIGALAVLTTHTAFWAGAYTSHGIWGSVLARLDVGVAIFFVLSGFLLARPWLARHDAGLPAPGVGRYFWKRILRIYPVYLITVVIALTLIHQPEPIGWERWLSNVFLVDIYLHFGLPAGLTQMWSLATEVAFYLLLPALMLALLGRRPREVEPGSSAGLPMRRICIGFAVLVAINVWWHLSLTEQLSGPGKADAVVWLPAYLTWFSMGIGLAVVHVRWTRPSPAAAPTPLLVRLGQLPGTCYVICAALLLCAATPLAGPTMLAVATGPQQLTKSLLYAAIGALVVLPGVFAPAASRYVQFMSLPWLRHVGLISYGIFCIHLPVLHFVMWLTHFELFRGHGLQIFALTVVLSLAAAEVLYRLVELPTNQLRNVGRPSGRTPDRVIV